MTYTEEHSHIPGWSDWEQLHNLSTIPTTLPSYNHSCKMGSRWAMGYRVLQLISLYRYHRDETASHWVCERGITAEDTTIYQKTEVSQIRVNGNIQWARVLSLRCLHEYNIGMIINRAQQTSIADCTQAGKNTSHSLYLLHYAIHWQMNSTLQSLRNNLTD